MPKADRFSFQYYSFKDADPQAVGEFLEALIDERNEHVTQEELIAAGKPAHSPIHSCFTWDDVEAAHKFRRYEAKRMVHALYREPKTGERRTHAFYFVHNPEQEGKRVMMSAKTVIGRPELREQLIEQAVKSAERYITRWEERYGKINALRDLRKAMKNLKAKAEQELLQAV